MIVTHGDTVNIGSSPILAAPEMEDNLGRVVLVSYRITTKNTTAVEHHVYSVVVDTDWFSTISERLSKDQDFPLWTNLCTGTSANPQIYLAKRLHADMPPDYGPWFRFDYLLFDDTSISRGKCRWL